MNIELLLESLLGAGRLKGKPGMTFDGRVIGDAEPGSPATSALKYLPSGWSEDFTSNGGRRSKRVDALRTKLYEQGFADVADRIPSRHITAPGDGKPSKGLSMAQPLAVLDPTKYPDPIDRQRQEGVRDRMNAWVSQSAFGNDMAKLELDYRGGTVGGIERYTIGSSQNLVDRRPYTAQPGSPPEQAFDLDVRYKAWTAQRTPARHFINPDDPQQGIENVMAYIPYVDHTAYDTMYKTDTDEDVGRYWESHVAALGIVLSGEQ